MIGIIFGEKGTGKTKLLLDHANKAVKEAKGSLVFIDTDTSYMYDLDSAVRFIDASEYGIHSPKMLYGFLCGIAAQDYDLEYIYIDGFSSFVKHEIDTLAEMFKNLEAFASGRGINIIISVSSEGVDVPEFAKPYILPLA